MANQENNEMVEIDGAMVTLEELAGLDLSNTKETRGMVIPAGTYVFEVTTDADGNPPGIRKVGDKFAVVFPCKVIDVIAIKNKEDAPNGDPKELIGKSHRESLFITKGESLEYITAFLVDIGVGKNGNIRALAASSVGKRFQAQITTNVNKDNKDIVYHNINRNQGKIIPEARKAA